jgi:WD40 repeat protein
VGDDWVLARWLDNERVVFLHRILGGQAVQPQDVVIYNAFTSEQSSLRLDLPNPYTFDNAGGPMNLIRASLDPALKRVVFIDKKHSLVLWDLETQKEMASVPLADDVSQFGSDNWSPDGKKFVSTSPNTQETSVHGPIPTANELFMFDMMNNKLIQLSHYNQIYQFANVTSPAWSPDNRYIAFWLRTGDDKVDIRNLQQWLAILDTSTLKTTTYRSSFDALSAPLWSPDGQQLIVRMIDRFALIDLTHKTRSIIPETQDRVIENWMTP